MEVSCSVWNLPYKANTKSQIILTVKIALIKKKKKYCTDWVLASAAHILKLEQYRED